MSKRWLIGVTSLLWLGLAFAATPRTVVLDVENMTCPACRITIDRALDNVPGVVGKQVDTKAATVTVTFDSRALRLRP